VLALWLSVSQWLGIRFQLIGLLATAIPSVNAHAVTLPAGIAVPAGAVVASEAGVVISTHGGIRVLDPQGSPIRRLWPEPPPPPRRRALGPDAWSAAPGLVVDADWVREYDTEALDDPDDPRLADDSHAAELDVTRPPRAARLAPPLNGRPTTMAAGGRSAWIGRADGLWQIDLPTGAAWHATAGTAQEIGPVAASSDGRIVAFFAGGRLHISRDGGEIFEAVAETPARPHGIAATNDGAVVFVQEQGQGERGSEARVGAINPGHGEVSWLTRLDRRAARDVVSCGDAVLVWGGGRLSAIRWVSGAEIVQEVPAAAARIDQVACGGIDGRLWVTMGSDLQWSVDRGRSWPASTENPAGSIGGLAASGTTIWLASTSGLWMVPNALGAATTSTPRPFRRDSSITGGDLPPGRPPPLAPWSPQPSFRWWWSTLLPRVDLALAAVRTGARRDLRVLLLLTFALDAPTSRQANDLTRLARQEDAERSAREIAVSQFDWADDDPLSAEERRALTRALLEDR